jgi:seryl-tRNA synthetase
VIRKRFDLSRVSDSGVLAILDGLRLDVENVRGHAFDEASRALEIEFRGEDAVEHVEAFIANTRRTHRLIARKVLKEHHARRLAITDIDAALAASPDVQILGDGLVGLRGDLLSLFRFFEREFRRLAAEFHAEDNHYPVMVPSGILEEVGYFSHFPQHITFCSHLPGSLPVLEAVAKSGQLSERLAEPEQVLTPAVCLPCYKQQRGMRLPRRQVRTLTMQNHVFRYEGTSFRPLSRGWDFTVRDIVFFGGPEDLSRLRGDVMDRALALCGELDLEVTIELANDPFFLDASRDKAIYQRMGEVKYELLFPLLYRQESLAASSFNLHRDFYTSVYDLRFEDGTLAESACMGFGLERWLYGFLSQKGLDPAAWPPRVTQR